MAKRFGFGRREKLKSRKQIEVLFQNGKSFPVFPLRVIYQFLPAEEGFLQVGVSASKRYFKKAVDRNRLKRLIREAYRLQKLPIIETLKKEKKQGFVFFMYTDKTIAGFDVIRDAMKKSLDRLEKQSKLNESPS
jgi:ribonuclease P protein component